MHTKQVYARHIRKWLNFEWKRQKKGSVNGTKEPFGKSMALRSPKSKFCALIFTLVLQKAPKSAFLNISQYHIKKMAVIVVSLFAGMLTICTP